MARVPQPPISNDNPSLHRSLTDIINFIHETFDNGVKQPSFTQQQIDSFTDLSFLGTILFNSTTNESNVAYLNGGSVAWRAV